jgi:HEAT repeat protein
MRRCLLLFLSGLLLSSLGALAADTPASDEDETLLKNANVGTDGPALLEFLRRHTRATAAADKLQALVKQLGDDSFEIREKATANLAAAGPAALAALREATKSRDPEVVDRARRCLRQIDTGQHVTARLALAAVRLLARNRPAGTVETLLAYVASHVDDFGSEELCDILGVLALGDGKPAPALVAAAGDAEPSRRLTAALALAHTRSPQSRAVLRTLARDADPRVHLEAALALAARSEPDAVPVLLDALVDPTPARSGRAEEALHAIAGALAPKVKRGTTGAERVRCRDAWAAWWQAADGTSLLKRLSDRAVQRTAQQESDGVAVTLALVRLLGFRKPDRAAKALLDYVPSAEDAEVVEAIHAALAELVAAGNKPDADVLAALTDAQPARRAAAGDAVFRAGRQEQTMAAHALLQDKEPLVRLHVALGAAGAGDKDAVPVLIALLPDLPLDQAWQAEDALVRLAGGAPEGTTLGQDAAVRAKSRDAWAAWWKDHAAAVEMHRLRNAPRLLGFTTLVLLEAGRVQEVDAAGKPRWKIDGLQLPLDFQMLPGERVLVAEHNGNRVTERNRRGDVLWFFDSANFFGLQGPQVAQRLPNGNTFIASRERMTEVDRDGNIVFSFQPAAESIMRAQRLPSGEMVGVYAGLEQRFVHLDPSGKELSTFPVSVHTYGGRLQMLPGGGALMPNHNANVVVEYGRSGNIVGQLKIDAPVAAVRLRNGNTLATSMPRNVTALATLPYRAVEVDRDGKNVWEFKADTKVTRALRR